MVLAAIALMNFLLIYSSTTSRNFCRIFRALLCKILVSAHFLQELRGVPAHFYRKLFRAVQAQCSNTGFTGCGKKRKTVILSAEFARRIPLGLLFSIGRDSSPARRDQNDNQSTISATCKACATQTFDAINIFNPAREITDLERVPPAKAVGDCGTL